MNNITDTRLCHVLDELAATRRQLRAEKIRATKLQASLDRLRQQHAASPQPRQQEPEHRPAC